MLFVNQRTCFIICLCVWCSELCQSKFVSRDYSTLEAGKAIGLFQKETNQIKRATTNVHPLTKHTRNTIQSTKSTNQFNQVTGIKSNVLFPRFKPVIVNTTTISKVEQTVKNALTHEGRTTIKEKLNINNGDAKHSDLNNYKNKNHTSQFNSTSVGNNPNNNGSVEISPCSYQHLDGLNAEVGIDAKDGLNVVNCSGLSLDTFSSSWFPENTNIILLDGNKLTSIPSSNFSHLHDLLKLSVSGNKISKIEDRAFDGLEKLEYLNLEDNDLDTRRSMYLADTFGTLRNLKELLLMYNVNIDNDANTYRFPDNVLGKLESLEHLTIDSFGDTLYFPSELGNQTKLSRLATTGNSRNIDATSFQNVRHLTELILVQFTHVKNFSDTALKPLEKLDSLTLNGVRIGVNKSLLALKPLCGKNMTTIMLTSVGYFSHDGYSSFILNDGVLDSTKTQYLLEICVKNFYLTHSSIYVIQPDAFAGSVWNRCLQSIDLSDNPLVGTKAAYIRIFNLKNIQTITMHHLKQNCDYLSFDQEEDFKDPSKKMSCNKLTSSNKQGNPIQRNTNSKCVSSGTPDAQDRDHFSDRSYKPGNFHKHRIDDIFDPSFDFFWATLSESLQTMDLKSSIGSSKLDINFRFIGANSLTYLDLSFNELSEFTGKITGLDALQTFMLSGNRMSHLIETFFDNFPSVENLYLSQCALDVDFMAQMSGRLLENLVFLKRFTISNNLLNYLASDTFHTNTNLQEINLSKNRFKTIPFDLDNTPNLKVLDLRKNSISTVGTYHRHKLDQLARQDAGFRLLLSGNVISCDCDNLPFLSWMRTTHVQLDPGVNLTCSGNPDDGSFVSDMDDLEAFWRKCNGT